MIPKYLDGCRWKRGEAKIFKELFVVLLLLRIVVNGMTSNKHCLYFGTCHLGMIQNGPAKSVERSILTGVQSRPTALNDLPGAKSWLIEWTLISVAWHSM